MLENICNWIILIGAAIGAIGTLYNFFAKPTAKLKTKKRKELMNLIEEQLNANVDEILEAHDKDLKEKFKDERESYYKQIKSTISDETNKMLKEIKEINLLQSEQIKTLYNSSKDMLRQRIMCIYHAHKKEKRMPMYDYEALEELYKDYKAEHGNSYIDKKYNRMKKWEVYDDEKDD